MRDPNRIDEVLELLGKVWHQCPDWRFWQLLLNIPWDTKGDLFFYEDDRVIKSLQKILEEGF